MNFQVGFCPIEAMTLLSLCISSSRSLCTDFQSIEKEYLKDWEQITVGFSRESNLSFEIGKSPGKPYYIIFRGEEYSEKNIKQDLEINLSHANGYAADPSARVQRAFRNEFESLLPDLLNWLKILSQNTSLNIYITGHGKGAAIATLCMAWLKEQSILQHPVRIKAYLFGSPRVGNTFFVREMNEVHKAKVWCFNIRHSRDMIPFIPLAPLMNPMQPKPLFCYKDVGELILLKGEIHLHGTTLTGTFSRHRAHWYAHYLKQQFQSEKGLGFPD